MGLMKMTAAAATWLLLMTAQLQSLVPTCRGDPGSETSALAGNEHLRTALEVRCHLVIGNNGSRNDLEYGDLKQRELEQDESARRADLVGDIVAERQREKKDRKKARKRTSPQQWYNIDGARSWMNVAPPARISQRRSSDHDAQPQALFQQTSGDVAKRFVEQYANNDDLLDRLQKRPYDVSQPMSTWPASHLRIWGKRQHPSEWKQLGNHVSSRRDDSPRKQGKNAHDLVRIWG